MAKKKTVPEKIQTDNSKMRERKIDLIAEIETLKRKDALKEEKIFRLQNGLEAFGTRAMAGMLLMVSASLAFLFLIGLGESDAPILAVFITSFFCICLASIVGSYISNDHSLAMGLIVSAMMGLIFGSLASGIGVIDDNIFNFCIYPLLTMITISMVLFFSYNKECDHGSEKVSYKKVCLLCSVFVLVICFGIYPLSILNNRRQIEHDKRILDEIQITSDSNGVEIKLPKEHIYQHRYMKAVLSLQWESPEGEKIGSWNSLSIRCLEGKTKWYKAQIPFPEHDPKSKIILLFNHAWEDLRATKDIP